MMQEILSRRIYRGRAVLCLPGRFAGAGVNVAASSPGRSLAMFPPGTVSFVPLQNPLKSGWPSAVLGAGADAAIASTAMLANPKPIRKMTLPGFSLQIISACSSFSIMLFPSSIVLSSRRYFVLKTRFFGLFAVVVLLSTYPRACSSLFSGRVRRKAGRYGLPARLRESTGPILTPTSTSM